MENINKRFARTIPKGKFRMEIFERDNYRCRICGASSDDNIYVRLEVHHIKPWEEGGLTIPENLITLCKLCHEGASKSTREVLYQKIGLHSPNAKHEFYSRNFQTADQYYAYIGFTSNIVAFKINTPNLLLKEGNDLKNKM